MQFNIQFLHTVPKPWDRGSEYRVFWESIRQAQAAERAGFDMVMAAEHHFLEEYSHSSSPEVFLTAVAQHTNRVKIAHGVRLLPFKYNHPVRVAEAAAMLDLASNGRLVLGIGRSSTLNELEGFGIDPATARAEMVESMEIVFKAWDGPFSHDGDLIQIPERNVLPKPIQTPHPQIWMAGGSPASLEPAGHAGYGASCLAFDLDVLDAVKARYKAAAAGESKPAEDAPAFPRSANPINQFSVAVFPFCTESERELRKGIDGIRWMMQAVFRYVGGLAIRRAASYEYLADLVDPNAEPKDARDEDILAMPQLIIGTPEMCIEKVELLADHGFDALNMVMSPPCGHAEMMETIRLFGERVIPRFRPYPDSDLAGSTTNDRG